MSRMKPHTIKLTTRWRQVAEWAFIACLLCCLGCIAFAESRTFVAVSLRNCAEEIGSVGGDAAKLKDQNPTLYFLAGITRPTFFVFDEDSGDAILVGEQSKDGVVLTMDDWITALRAAIIHPEEDPGVTIDPVACDACKHKKMFGCPHTSKQRVKFFGGIENTHFGKICYEADWWMKLLAAGTIESPVKSIRSFVDLVGDDAQANRMNASLFQTRFWFYPIINQVNLLDNLVLLQDFQMGVFTEVMYAEENGRPVLDLTRQYNAPSEKFAKSLTDSFVALAQSQPPLASLRELTRLSALAKGCARSSSKFEFRKLISSYHSIKVTTPTEKEVVVQRDMLRRLEYRGGVELKALAMRLKEGDASALRQLVLKARPAPSALSWKFIVRLENGIPEGVNIPPQNETGQDAGALLAQGFFLYDRNRFADAAKCFDSILRLFPNCDDAAWAKAMTLREEAITKAGGAVDIAFKQVQKSTELLEQLVKRNPLCVQAFFQLGITHRAFRSNTEAIHDFEQAIKIAPDFAAAHYALGLTWKDTKNYSNAAKCFRAALSLESDTETARDATEQLALVEKGLKEGGKRAFKEYALKQQGISLRHPDDWLVMTPEEMLKRAKGNTVLTPECVLVIANPDNWAQNVTIQVREAKGYDVIPPKELEALSQNLTQQMTSHVDGFKDLGHQIIEVSAVPALEMDSLSSAWGKKHQQRSVLFVKQERLYTITCSSTESEFADANAKAFSVIIDGLKVQSSSGQASRSSFGKSSIDKPDPIGLPLMILLGICVVVGLGVARRSGNAT